MSSTSTVLAGGIIDWITTKTGEVNNLVPDVLQTVVLLGVVALAIKTRSWIKCATFALGCAIVLWLTGNLTWARDLVKDEVQSAAPAISVVQQVTDQTQL